MKPLVANERDRFVAAFDEIGREGAEWIAPLRRRAIDAFAVLGFPTTRDEAWKYTDLRSALKEAILSAWHPGRPALLDRLWGSDFLPEELRFDKDQPEGKVPDPAWVFLARVVIGVSGNTDTGNRPIRTGAVAINNEMRPFAVTVAALARWLGI